MTSKQELLALHKKQQRDLIANITSLKKQATKKTRKNVLNQCQQLQDDLNYKQNLELKQFDDDVNNNQTDADTTTEVTPESLLQQLHFNSHETNSPQDTNTTDAADINIMDTNDINDTGASDMKATGDGAGPSNIDSAISNNIPKKKRNRQKERLARRQQEIDKIKHEASLEAENCVDYRSIEIESMNQLLKFNNLKNYDIKPDGNCLFSSIKHQLENRHIDLSDDYQLNNHNLQFLNYTIEDYRKISGDYILENKQDFIPFLFDENTGECKDINDYVNELTSTSMWGSDMEILALSKIFNCSVHIFLAGASTIVINENGELPPLKIAYYKHSYGLGEHYNSLIDEKEI